MLELDAIGCDVAHSPYVPFPGARFTVSNLSSLVRRPDIMPSANGIFEKLDKDIEFFVQHNRSICSNFYLLPDQLLDIKVGIMEQMRGYSPYNQGSSVKNAVARKESQNECENRRAHTNTKGAYY